MPTPEVLAREKIDQLLTAAGWAVQDYRAYNPSASQGIALREVPLASGRCDYLLLVDHIPVGVIEAEKQGTTLSTIADQPGPLRQKSSRFPRRTASEKHRGPPFRLRIHRRRNPFPRPARSRHPLAPRLCLSPATNFRLLAYEARQAPRAPSSTRLRTSAYGLRQRPRKEWHRRHAGHARLPDRGHHQPRKILRRRSSPRSYPDGDRFGYLYPRGLEQLPVHSS